MTAFVCFGLLVAGWLAPLHAGACSGGSCFGGEFVPKNGATIPANTPALAWLPPVDHRLQGTDPAPPPLELTRIDTGNQKRVAVALKAGSGGYLWIVPEALEAGARYRLESSAMCTTPAIEFQVSAPADLPSELGMLQLSAAQRERVTVATIAGSCDIQLSAISSHLDVALASAARAWSDLFMYRTVVDNKAWSPSWSLIGSDEIYKFTGAQDMLFSECLQPGETFDPYASHDGLAQGEHRVYVEAQLPDSSTKLITSEQTITFSCNIMAADPPPTAGKGAAGSDTTGDAASNGGTSAAGLATGTPIASESAAGSSAGVASPSPVKHVKSCSVQAPRASAAPAAWSLVLALVALRVRRRLG